MKKFIFIFMTVALSLVLALNVGATELAELTDTAVPTDTEAVSVTEDVTEEITAAEAIETEVQTDAQTDAPAESKPMGDADGEEYIPLDEFLLRLWDEYRDSIFSVLSAILSLVVTLVLKKKYIPGINTKVSGVSAQISAQNKKLDDFKVNVNGMVERVENKLTTFEDYDKLSKEMKQVLADAQLDRRVLIKTIELQADQIEHLIEYSHLSQARKEQLYESYRAQMKEIKKLKGEGESEA